jgi:hypothetical protein
MPVVEDGHVEALPGRPRPAGRSRSLDIAAVNRRVIEQFRAGGEIEGMHREALVLLTTTGAKTVTGSW